MRIGLPRAFLYYKYKYLWETFFKALDCQIILSEDTNKKILADGIKYSIDESCLPSKIYMGHVYSLIGKCDYILVPRVENFGPKEKVCVKFNAMYDIVKNTFPETNLIDYNINIKKGKNELKGFLQMGRMLNKSSLESFRAYKQAKQVQIMQDKQKVLSQEKLFEEKQRLKILLVSHPYNVYDKMIGFPIIEQIKKLGGVPVFADAVDSDECKKRSSDISKSLYWTYNKELLGAISLYEDKIDGIILITAFPCGPDSLVNELIIRKQKKTPVANIILDELQGEVGLQTRIESFMDIINEKRKMKIHG